jgi:hypothetical protein
VDNLQYCFDQNFYNSYYSNSVDLGQFIKDNVHDGRFTHPCIINDNFDYGLFISELNWQNIKIDNEYASIKYFLDNRDKYSHLFIDSDTDQYRRIDRTNCFAIYVANIQSNISENIMIDSLERLSQNIDNIYILVLGNKLSDSTYEKYKDNIISIDKIKKLKSIISQYKYCLYANNNICLNDHLSKFMQAMPLNSQLLTLIDMYTNYHNRRYRCINTDLMLIDVNILIKLLKQILINFNNNLNYCVTKFLKHNDIIYRYYSKQTYGKEILWDNLFSHNLIDHKTISEEYSIPAISLQSYRILYNNLSNVMVGPNLGSHQSIVSNINQCVNNHIDKAQKIACHIHIGYTEPRYLQDIKDFMSKLKNWNITYFITSNKPIKDIDTFILPNKGADIGPFLYVLNHFILPADYNLVIKIHTKNHHGFRKMCFDTIANNFAYIQFLLNAKKNCNIAGAYQKNMMLDTINNSVINKFCLENNIQIDPKKIDFFTGTMFVCKTSMFQNFINQYRINISKEYLSLESGYIKNHQATYTHSWERILSGIIPYCLHSSKIYIS